MKNTTILLIVGIAIIAVGAFFFVKAESGSGVSGGVTTGNSGGSAQKVVISMKDLNYYPQTIHVKAGQPVSISLDQSVGGCFRSFNIKGLGISKYSQSPQDTIDFTPKTPGTYRFACGMGMASGTIIVE